MQSLYLTAQSGTARIPLKVRVVLIPPNYITTSHQIHTRSTPEQRQVCHKNHGDLTQRASRAQMNGFDSLFSTCPLGLTFLFISSMLDDWQRGACWEEWNGDNGRCSGRWQLEWVAAQPSCNYEHGNDNSKQQPESPAQAEYQLRTMRQGKEEKKGKHSNRLANCHVLFVYSVWVIRYGLPALSEYRAIGRACKSQYGLL